MSNNYQITEKRHSRLGIASTAIGIALPVLLVLFIVAGVFLGTQKGTTGNDVMVVLMLISLSFPFLHLMALVFGIIGWASKKTKNLFPVAGVILNGFFLLAGIFLVFFIITNLKFPG